MNLIKMLEESMAPKPLSGHVDLRSLSPEDREKAFVKFGEGDEDLTNLLRVAYSHNIDSIFCCSGHGLQGKGYVMFKVTPENIKHLQKVEKYLSRYGISTDFSKYHGMGTRIVFRHIFDGAKYWFDKASYAISNIEECNYNNPTLYYHEQISSEYIPTSYKIKSALLNLLRNHTLKKRNDIKEETATNKTR